MPLLQGLEEENKNLEGEKQALAGKIEELSQASTERKASDAEDVLQLRQQIDVLRDTNATLCKENLELITELEAQQQRIGEDSFVFPNPAKLKAELMASAKGRSPFKSPAPSFNKFTGDSFGAEIFQDDDSFLANTPKPLETTPKPAATSTPTAPTSDKSFPRKRTTLGNIAINSPMPSKKMKKDMPSAIKPCSTSAVTDTAPKAGGVAVEEEKPNECKTQ